MHVVDFEEPGPKLDRVFLLGPIALDRPGLQMQPTLRLRAVVPAAFAPLSGLRAMRAAYAEIPLRL